jgi:predicted GNAT family N-acyltransferase
VADGQDEKEDLSHDCDFHITLYKDDQVVLWMMLCPSSKTTVKLKTKYTNGSQDCGPIEERVLQFAENWAKDLGYKQIIIHACLVSEAFYNRLGYKCTGEIFSIASQEHCKMLKDL